MVSEKRDVPPTKMPEGSKDEEEEGAMLEIHNMAEKEKAT
jgi:hypothetical protein